MEILDKGAKTWNEWISQREPLIVPDLSARELWRLFVFALHQEGPTPAGLLGVKIRFSVVVS
jgi:hypothetical protein